MPKKHQELKYRVLATFTLPPDHRRIAIVTPLISGGSLLGILEWRSRLASPSIFGRRSSLPFPSFNFPSQRKKEETLVERSGCLTEEEVKAVVKQVLEGLVYLHNRGYLHVSYFRAENLG